MKINQLGALTFLAASVLAVAGCGTSTGGNSVQPTTAGTTTPVPATAAPTTAATAAAQASNQGGACGLITSAEAQTAVGAPLGPPQLSSVPPQNGLALETCTYPRTTGGQGVIVGIYSYGSGITSSLFNQYRQSKGDTTTVTGVGDEAFKTASHGAGQDQVTFRKGSKAALVSLAADTNLESSLLALCQAAAGRL